jgi:DNA-directed RNA polymerase specialized sigma24 family protein
MSAGNDPGAEDALIQRCIAGEQDSWFIFYRDYHQALLGAVLVMLGRHSNPELAEEIAARVWASLILQNGNRLKAFDPERGALTTYLAALAHQEMLRWFRPRSKQGQEVPLHNEQRAVSAAEMLPGFLWEGFVATLTRKERWYWDTYVMDPPDTPPPADMSPGNFRKLKQRVLQKLNHFLNR